MSIFYTNGSGTYVYNLILKKEGVDVLRFEEKKSVGDVIKFRRKNFQILAIEPILGDEIFNVFIEEVKTAAKKKA